MRDIDEITFLAIFGNFLRRVQKLLRKSKNDLFKVPSRCNFLKEKVLFIEIGALLPVANLFTVKKKKEKRKKINIIVKPIHFSLRSESNIKINIVKTIHFSLRLESKILGK